MTNKFPELDQIIELLDSHDFEKRAGEVMRITDSGNEASLEITYSYSQNQLFAGEVYQGTSNMAPTLYTPQGHVRICDFHSHPHSDKAGFISPSPPDLTPIELSYSGFWSEAAANYFRENDVGFRSRRWLQNRFSDFDFTPLNAEHIISEEGYDIVKPTQEQVEEYKRLEEQFGEESPFFGIFGRVGENVRLLLYHLPENREYSGLVNTFERKYFEPSSEPSGNSFKNQDEVVKTLERECDIVLVKDYKL